ncbi:MCE family protein [Marinobacter halodurans]|uniref:MCE family protein n=1 Tax=Marinobacter halodurans TaxID=2528979 RepID=A0ABY1ZEX3_9GAMM|nr:MlaD family protein [Marinobacter halodurans]TBW49091.1 MCE family protein [Marinobacter halodurans]
MTNGQTPQSPAEADVKSRRWSLSLVWLVPLVAALVGLSMLIRAWHNAGPTVEVTFETAGGLTPGQSQVKYRNVVIGSVSDIRLSKDHKKVVVTIDLNREAKDFARKDSRYWVVRPRIGTGGVSGLDTLLSGDFIAADPGDSQQRATRFEGLENPPPVTYGEPGKRFKLKAGDLGSLDIGSPIYYRKVRVGQVVSYSLDESGDGVNVDIFINAPNDRYVTADTRFWNASGIDIGVSANGLELDSESLLSVLTGGVAFATPDRGADSAPAEPGSEFQLFSEKDAALSPGKGPPQRIRMRFDQSLRGLKEGSPVELIGKEIGEVTRVTLDYDANSKTFPVIVDARIYPQMLGQAYGKLLTDIRQPAGNLDEVHRLFEELVKQGLRAEARTSNLLTGQLYVALEIYPDARPVAFDVTRDPIHIPTRPTSLDKLQEQLTRLVDRFSKIPFESIAENMNDSLAELHKTLGTINSDVMPSALQTLRNIDGVMTDMRSTLNQAADALDPDSPERTRIGHALDEVERMSRSVRELSDYLRRHPEAMIRGRSQPVRSEN